MLRCCALPQSGSLPLHIALELGQVQVARLLISSLTACEADRSRRVQLLNTANQVRKRAGPTLALQQLHVMHCQPHCNVPTAIKACIAIMELPCVHRSNVMPSPARNGCSPSTANPTFRPA